MDLLAPYVGTKNGSVLYRYFLNGKIQFKVICRDASPDDAKKIAKLLNRDMVVKRP